MGNISSTATRKAPVGLLLKFELPGELEAIAGRQRTCFRPVDFLSTTGPGIDKHINKNALFAVGYKKRRLAERIHFSNFSRPLGQNRIDGRQNQPDATGAGMAVHGNRMRVLAAEIGKRKRPDFSCKPSVSSVDNQFLHERSDANKLRQGTRRRTIMNLDATGKTQDLGLDIAHLSARIAGIQQASGEIPWCSGKKTDPWDHVEAAMGLSVGGRLQEAHAAYAWLAANQNADGSWFAAYRRGRSEDRTRDANMSAYVAVGALQHFLISGDVGFLRRLWPTVDAAIDFALSLQSPHGEIYWAISPAGRVDRMALLTGSSSICLSIKCALAIGRHLGYTRTGWQNGLRKLENAIRHKPHRFNMTKSRYAMDWYYPVLCGVVTGPQARERIDRHWKRYVIDGQGVRCVFDAPWITIAETSELALALAAMGDLPLARVVFSWIGDKRYADGGYWAGFTFPDMTVWPTDKLSWTDAAVLLAADALFELTPACRLFSHRHWKDFGP